MNLITPKAAAKNELPFNKLAQDTNINYPICVALPKLAKASTELLL